MTHAKGALVNYGTAILEGATFTRSAEASTSATSSGGNSWYVIDNHGTMTITGTANVVNNGYFSSLIEASTSATSSGGNSWYVIDNHGTMTITGTANVVNNGYFSSLIRNIGTADAASSLTVSGNATLGETGQLYCIKK